ncbi:hypothetical protein CYLTODRAFT_365789 [Cylindrobasidium torrendii FP15055 ss-10]|uniref:Pyridoxamine 5'-phosphate oxidase N-terminal domain-containing protein n=1 Tax=Cylindrobasidium torrendii FP15055 ss-10 TaxID=1314674 RepID=A0A0D7BSE0_9AGAR|nr:hypothetical protein CYLTODRAFT_365789 [Cylindrobasidium torrendii FP15055 ss-10]
MGKFFDSMPKHVMAQIPQQKMFWVATAPSQGGHVNLSPKGLEGTFHIIDEHTVWYEDLTGSGNETVSHLRENGRITILFNFFDGPPGLIRLFGKGHAHEFGTQKYNELIPAEKRQPGSRAVIIVDVTKVGTSCGYQVPFYQFVGHRTRLLEWASKKEKADIENQGCKNGMREYWATTNEKSVDGLPGMIDAVRAEDGFLQGPRLGPFKKDDERVKASRSCDIKTLVDLKTMTGFVLGVVASLAYRHLLV